MAEDPEASKILNTEDDSLDSLEPSVDDSKIKIENKLSKRKTLNLDKRISELEDALAINESRLGEDIAAIASDICDLAIQYFARAATADRRDKGRADLEKAQELFLRARKMQDELYESQHAGIANTFVHLGNCARDLRNFKEAESYYRLAKELVERSEREGNPLAGRAFFFENYAEFLKKASKYEEADYYLGIAKKPAGTLYKSFEEQKRSSSQGRGR